MEFRDTVGPMPVCAPRAGLELGRKVFLAGLNRGMVA
jgi:hypothetical protein